MSDICCDQLLVVRQNVDLLNGKPILRHQSTPESAVRLHTPGIDFDTVHICPATLGGTLTDGAKLDGPDSLRAIGRCSTSWRKCSGPSRPDWHGPCTLIQILPDESCKGGRVPWEENPHTQSTPREPLDEYSRAQRGAGIRRS